MRSKKTAEVLKKYLPILLQQVEPWMSSKDIYKGDVWMREVGENLNSHQIGIICVTPENVTSPWILFEAGAISKQLKSSKVFPLLLGMNPSDVYGPLSQFQSTVIEKNDFKKLIQSINSLTRGGGVSKDVLDVTFDIFWPRMEEDLINISEVKIEGTALNIANVTSVFRKYGLPEPAIGNHIYFSSGFESHNLYSIAYEVAQKRIWIWGRKNRKVFDKEHKNFFSRLRDLIALNFDFRVLFLDPNSDATLISRSHKDADFSTQLESSIVNACQTCTMSGVEFSDISRCYNSLRNTGMVIVDDAILYSPIQYDKNGYVEPLTKSPFNIVGSESNLGIDLEQSFLNCWQNSSKLVT